MESVEEENRPEMSADIAPTSSSAAVPSSSAVPASTPAPTSSAASPQDVAPSTEPMHSVHPLDFGNMLSIGVQNPSDQQRFKFLTEFYTPPAEPAQNWLSDTRMTKKGPPMRRLRAFHCRNRRTEASLKQSENYTCTRTA
ncbi:hypothetical protein ANCDUO_23414 [Ancylostoma duodenale]|uniref:Uncharacterized protein n=1 Tax=Ancylostoma duodenale TaxID=51022 RepID=A0A0C2BRS8_9BILA|nr:hypothetical protein ANCDUO_23414 [Ancylostoma duodenale]